MTAVDVYRTSPVKRHRATKAEMADRLEAIANLAAEHAPATVRNIYYRAVVAGLVPKTESGYGKVQRALVTLRRSGDLPYGWIADNTRWQRRPTQYQNVSQALEDWASSYRRDFWTNTYSQVEVWCESDSIAGVIVPVTAEWGVGLFPVKGFSSITFAQSAAEAANYDGRPLVIYYIGDHDPHGLDIDRSLRRELDRHLEVPLTFQRIGVAWEQVEALDLPGTKPKKSYGYPLAVEAEALPPGYLRDLVGAALEQHVDPWELEVHRTAEASERELLRRIVDREVA